MISFSRVARSSRHASHVVSCELAVHAFAAVQDGPGDDAVAAVHGPCCRCNPAKTGVPGRRGHGAPRRPRRRQECRRQMCRYGRNYAPFSYLDNVLSLQENHYRLYEKWQLICENDISRIEVESIKATWPGCPIGVTSGHGWRRLRGKGRCRRLTCRGGPVVVAAAAA